MKKVSINNIIYESIKRASVDTNTPSSTILWRINSKNLKFKDYFYLYNIEREVSFQEKVKFFLKDHKITMNHHMLGQAIEKNYDNKNHKRK